MKLSRLILTLSKHLPGGTKEHRNKPQDSEVSQQRFEVGSSRIKLITEECRALPFTYKEVSSTTTTVQYSMMKMYGFGSTKL
jgi:hypothetical protein